MVKVTSPKPHKSSYYDPIKVRAADKKHYVDPLKADGYNLSSYKGNEGYKQGPYNDPTKIRQRTPIPYKDPLRSEDPSSKPRRQYNHPPPPVRKQQTKPPPPRYVPPPRKETPPPRRNSPPPPRKQKPAKQPPPRHPAPRKKASNGEDPLKQHRAYDINGPYDDPLQHGPHIAMTSAAVNQSHLSYKDNPYVDPIPAKEGHKKRRKVPLKQPEQKYTVQEQPREQRAQPQRTVTPAKSRRVQSPPPVFVAPVPIRQSTPPVKNKSFATSSTQYQPVAQRTMVTQTDARTIRTFGTQSDSNPTKTSSIQTDDVPTPVVVPVVGNKEQKLNKVPTKTMSTQCDDLPKPAKTIDTQTSPYMFEHPPPVIAPRLRSRSPEYQREDRQRSTYQYEEPRRYTPSPTFIPIVAAAPPDRRRSPTPRKEPTPKRSPTPMRSPTPQRKPIQRRSPTPMRSPTPNRSPPRPNPLPQYQRSRTPVYEPQPQPSLPPYNSPPRSAQPVTSPEVVVAAPLHSHNPAVRQPTPPRRQVPKQSNAYPTSPERPMAVAENGPEVFAAVASPKKSVTPFPSKGRNNLPPEISSYIEAYDTVRLPGEALGSIQRSLRLV